MLLVKKLLTGSPGVVLVLLLAGSQAGFAHGSGDRPFPDSRGRGLRAGTGVASGGEDEKGAHGTFSAISATTKEETGLAPIKEDKVEVEDEKKTSKRFLLRPNKDDDGDKNHDDELLIATEATSTATIGSNLTRIGSNLTPTTTTTITTTMGAVDVSNPLRFYKLDGGAQDSGSEATKQPGTLHDVTFNGDESVLYNQKSAIFDNAALVQARFVFITRVSNSYHNLVLSKVEVYDVDGNNVALNKHAQQRPNYDDSSPASNAVDGKEDTKSETSLRSGTDWWRVDLGQFFSITRVVVETESHDLEVLLRLEDNPLPSAKIVAKRSIGQTSKNDFDDFPSPKYISIPPANNLGSFSIGIWVYLIGTPAEWSRIIDFGSPSYENGGLAISPNDYNCKNKLGVHMHGKENQFLFRVCTSTTLSSNTWHHVAVTYDKGGDGAKLYLDGKMADSSAYNTKSFNDWPSTNAKWYIARSNQPSNPYFNGRMQDLRVYDGALSPDDVKGLHASPKGELTITFKESGRNDRTETVMPKSPMIQSTWSSLDLNQVYLKASSELSYKLPQQAFSKESVNTYLTFDFTPKTIGLWHRIKAYGVEMYIAGTDDSKTYTDKAASANAKKSYQIKLSGMDGFTDNSEELVLDQSGDNADSTFGNVAISLKCPDSATVEKSPGSALCRCTASYVAQALDDQGEFQDTEGTEVNPDPTKGKCRATWGFAMDETSTSIRLHGMNLPESLRSSVSSVKVTAYQRASSSERTVVFKYKDKTLPKDNLIEGYNLNGLVPGIRYDVEVIPIKEENGNRVEMTDSKITQSIVTHCSCFPNDDSTGAPSGLAMKQKNGYVFFEWKDRSQCEESFTLSRRSLEDFVPLRLTEGLSEASVILGPDVKVGSDKAGLIDGVPKKDEYSKTPYASGLTDYKKSVYVDIDLGDTYSITEITVWHYYDGRKHYSQTVEISQTGVFDGEEQVVYDTGIGNPGPAETEAGNKIVLPRPILGRFVRHRCGRSNTNQWVRFIEISVNGKKFIASDEDEVFKPNFPVLAKGKDKCIESPIKPGTEAADDLRLSNLRVGNQYVYCVAASAAIYMHNPSSESAPALTSSNAACGVHKVNWEASISGRVTLSPSAGSHPVRDALVSWELLGRGEEGKEEEPNVLASGSTKTGPSGLFNIIFNEALDLLNDEDYPVRVRASKTTSALNAPIKHRFLCDNEATDCTDAGTLVYLHHLDFDEPLRFIDATSVQIRGKIVVADTDDNNNDSNDNSGDGCILQGVEVCLKQKHVQTIDTEELCVQTESDGTYGLPATIGTKVTVEAKYENHTFAPLKRDASLYEHGFLVEPQGDNGGHDFKDTTVVDLIVEVAGGLCNHKLGKSTVSIEMPGGCKWRKDLQQSEYRESHQVPAQLLQVRVRKIEAEGGNREYTIEEALAGTVNSIDLRVMKEEEEAERKEEELSNSTASTESDVLPVPDSDLNVAKCEEADEKDVASEGRRVRFQYDGELKMEVKLTGDDIGSDCGLENYETTSKCDSLHVLETLKTTKPEVKLVRQLKEDLSCDIVEEDLTIRLTNELGTLSTYDKQFWGEYPDLGELKRVLLERCSYDSGSCSGQVKHDDSDSSSSLQSSGKVKHEYGDSASSLQSSVDVAMGYNDNEKSNSLRHYKLDGNAQMDVTSYNVAFEGNFGPGTDKWGVFKGDSALFTSKDKSYIEIDDYYLMLYLGSFTISIWIYLIGEPDTGSRIIDFGSPKGEYGAFVISPKNGRCGDNLGVSAWNYDSKFLYDICSSTKLPQNEWHHIAITYDKKGHDKKGDGGKLYLDGTLAGSNPYNEESFEDWTTYQWFLGKSNWDSDPYFNGRMQDLQIYDYSLSKSVVEALYEEGQAASARWHHDHADSFNIRGEDDYQYRYNKELLSWGEHERLAKEWGGHLASFDSQSAFNDFLFELRDHGGSTSHSSLASSLWVGLKQTYAGMGCTDLNDPLQKEYRGTKSYTASGIQCQRWDQQSPHSHSETPQTYPTEDLVENYCRNPDDWEGGAWCYTVDPDPDKRWETCDVPTCGWQWLNSTDAEYTSFAQSYWAPEEPSGSSTGYTECTDPDDPLQKDYRGTMSRTASGIQCQRWDQQSPHSHPHTTPQKYPTKDLVENYCRNPDDWKDGAWCYTMQTDPDKSWETCSVPTCTATKWQWLQHRGYSSSKHEGKFHSAPASMKFPAVYKRKKDIVAAAPETATCASTKKTKKKKNAHIAEELFLVGPPNRQGDHTRSLYIQAGSLFHRACVIVTGDYKLKEVGSFGLPTHEPILLLRDPPGGLSYASYENVETTIKVESKEFETYVGFDVGVDLGIGASADAEACVGIGTVACAAIMGFDKTVGVPIGGGGDYLAGYESMEKSGEFSTTWTYQTSDNPWLAGSKSDAFVVPNLDVKFSQVDTFTWKRSTCKLDEKTDYKFNLEAPGNKPALSFVTKYDLETYEIPLLQKINASHTEELANITADTGDDPEREVKREKTKEELSRVQEGLKGWRSFLDEYEKTNKNAKEGKLNDYVPSTWFETWVKENDMGDGEPAPDNHWSGLAPESLAGRAVGYGAEWKEEERKIESGVKNDAQTQLDECLNTCAAIAAAAGADGFAVGGVVGGAAAASAAGGITYEVCKNDCEGKYDPISGSWAKEEMIERKNKAIRDTRRIKFSGGGGTMEFTLLHHMVHEVQKKMDGLLPHDNSVGRVRVGADYHKDADILGLAFRLDVEGEVHVDWSRSHKLTNANEKETSISFVLGDDEESDRFSVDIYIDPRYGTFIFATQGGQSRCPREEGTMAVGAPKINMVKWPTKHVLPDEWMIFNLELINEGADMTSFELIVDNNNGILDLDYRLDGDRFDRFESKATTAAVFAVRKGPSDYVHDPFKLTLRQVCEGEAGTTGYYSDTGHDSVEVYNNQDTKKIEFAQPCPTVDWAGDLKRDRSFSFNKKDEGTLLKEIPIVVFNPQYSIGSFANMVNTTRLQSVHLWHREVGSMDWVPVFDGAKQVDFANSALASIEEEDSYGYTLGLWKFGDEGVQDGVYEIMVETKCETIPGAPDEFNFIRTPPIRGVIDRQEPKLFGLPTPQGAILQLGEPMSFAFSENVDCEKPFRFEFKVSVSSFDTAFNKDNLLITCKRNEISFTFDGTKTNFDELKGKAVTVTLSNVVDLVGNPIVEPIEISKEIANVNLEEASTSFTMELEGANCKAPLVDGSIRALRDQVANLAHLSSSERIEVGRVICASQGRRIIAEITILPRVIGGNGRFLGELNNEIHSIHAFNGMVENLQEDAGRSDSRRKLEHLLGSDATVTVKDIVVNPSQDDILRNPHWVAIPEETDVVDSLDHGNLSLFAVNEVTKAELLKMQQVQQQDALGVKQEVREAQQQMQQQMQQMQRQTEQQMQQMQRQTEQQMQQMQRQTQQQIKNAMILFGACFSGMCLLHLLRMK